MFDSVIFSGDCSRIRESSPLVHNITNYVAMNIAANALLAIGASPLMSFCPDEMADIVSQCSSVAINLGCLDTQLIKASRIAAAAASGLNRPWVLDPVGAGFSELRTRVSSDLAFNYGPSVIRGNASEILALSASAGIDAGNLAAPKGVDSTGSFEKACECAFILASRSGSVISVSGPEDFITDGVRVGTVPEGHPMMPRVTAMGCTATAITGAFLAVQPDSFVAALNAMKMMGICGSRAGLNCHGTGTFAVRFVDELSKFDTYGNR